MENLFKKQYEISLWEDVLYWHRRKLIKVENVAETEYKPGKYYSQDSRAGVQGAKLYVLDLEHYDSSKTYYSLAAKEEGNYLEGDTASCISIEPNDENWYAGEELVPNTIFQFYKEQKICVIGSDTMDSPIRAHQPKLVANTNGSSTLTFSIYYKYYDEESGTIIDNPFTKLLVNERKVKLRHGELGAENMKWYDFIIKSVQENTENHTFTYTAKSLFINELSKSGFNLQFDAKLENNQGTILELANYVLEGSDWQLHPDADISLQQTKSEALYEFTLKEGTTLKATSMDESREEIELGAGAVIYGFYTSVSEKLPFFQFLYCAPDGQGNSRYEVDEERHIINSPNYCVDNIEYEENGYPKFAINNEDSFLNVTTTYRGKRVVRQIITQFDSVMDRYVGVYKDNKDKIVYGYIDEQYISPTSIRNFVVNASDYDSTIGWDTSGIIEELPKEEEEDEIKTQVVQPEIKVQVLPDIFDKDYQYDPDLDYKSFLSIKFKDLNQGLINFGLAENRSTLNGFTIGQRFIFKIKCGLQKDQNDIAPSNLGLNAKIVKYKLENGIYQIEQDYAHFSAEELECDENGYITANAICTNSMSYSEMTTSKIGLYIYPTEKTPLDSEIYIENVQLFYEEYDANGEQVYPGGELIARIKQEYVYYYPPALGTMPEEIVELYRGEVPSEDYIQQYNDSTNYEKIRSITAQESNRFNLIQDLCEVFECWPKFIIEHDIDGTILMDENYRQLKWVDFKEFIGNQNDIGFRYGINLKSITRTIDSEAIVTKMIVKNNSNEYATDGFCSIARAQENPNRQNFLLQFDYYISQEMLNSEEVTNDLYNTTNGYIGYYTRLKEMSIRESQIIIEQSNLSINQSELEAAVQVAKISCEESEVILSERKADILALTTFSFEEIMNPDGLGLEEKETAEGWRENQEVRALCASIVKLQHMIPKLEAEKLKAENDLAENLSAQEEKTEELANIKAKKLALDLQFYKKYSRFLQEGSWIDENYTDDNLYYLDAESTLYTSAHPKVTYNINVLELSRIPEYENYIFNLGDKTFIEDTEFFGWVYSSDGIRTPRHEEIIVNEITIMLDSPEQNEIKVQNYKTQFEDLFQRITATTQVVEYSTGKYNKVTTIIQEDGTIAPSTLSNSMQNNSFVLSNAKDQSVVWDSSGITTTSLSNPNEMLRIVSGGLFISNDGGSTWSTGITGHGINASYLTSGSIDTSKIRIMAGAHESFRWDSTGLNAYKFTLSEDGKTVSNYSSNQFVRFDQFGMYGIKGLPNFNPFVPESLDNGTQIIGEEKIWNKASFALTWNGFVLNNDDGSVKISSNEDIQILANGSERIKIGRLGQDNNENTIYGLRIKDKDNNTVMVTKDDGTLWIENALYIGADTKSINEATVRIGLLEEIRDGVHEVIHAGNNENQFIVYEDGKMYASGAEFHGKIYATGGEIGGMTIEELQGAVNEKSLTLIITSSNGTYFKNGIGDTVLTAKLYQGGKEIDSEGTNYTYTWSWVNKDGVKVTQNSKTLSVEASAIGEGRVYACEAILNEKSGGI